MCKGSTTSTTMMVSNENEDTSNNTANDEERNNLQRRVVSFRDVQVYEFAPALGDCPYVSSGAPIALGDKVGGFSISVNAYEQIRVSKRTGFCMSIDQEERLQRLLSEGYTVEEIACAIVEAQFIKEQIKAPIINRNWPIFKMRKSTTARAIHKLLDIRPPPSPVPPRQATAPTNTTTSDSWTTLLTTTTSAQCKCASPAC